MLYWEHGLIKRSVVNFIGFKHNLVRRKGLGVAYNAAMPSKDFISKDSKSYRWLHILLILRQQQKTRLKQGG